MRTLIFILSVPVVLVSACLPLGINRAVGRAWGAAMVLFKLEAYRVALYNLRLCFPDYSEEKCARHARGHVLHLCQGLMESGIVWLAPRRKVIGLCTGESGAERVARACARSSREGASSKRSSGTLLLFPHMGNWEIATSYLPWRLKTEVHVLYAPLRHGSRLANRFIHAMRKRKNFVTHPANVGGMRAIAALLRQGKTVMVLPDQEPRYAGSGIYAPFFAVDRAFTTTLAARLMRYVDKENVFFGFTLRVQNGFEFHFEPLDYVHGMEQKEAVRTLNRHIEKAVVPFLDQYLWSYKRFKRTFKETYRKV